MITNVVEGQRNRKAPSKAADFNKRISVILLGLILHQAYYLGFVHTKIHESTTDHEKLVKSRTRPTSDQQESERPMKRGHRPEVYEQQKRSSFLAKPSMPPKPPPPKQKLLPKRLITIFGAESSGTTFLSTALGVATGAFAAEGKWQPVPLSSTWKFEKGVDRRVMSDDGEWEIQHISLPWGWNCATHETLDIVEALIPEECSRNEYYPQYTLRKGDGILFKNKGRPPNTPPPTHPDFTLEEKRILDMCQNEVHIRNNNGTWSCGAKCGSGAYDGFALYPKRFSVNISSHIDWYVSRGVDITAILSVRDRNIHMKGKMAHCRNEALREKEEDLALQLMDEALDRYGKRRSNGDKERAIVVSYEGLMGMKEAYLFELYHQLGINSRYAPEFKDGNAKYVTKQKGLQESDAIKISKTTELGESIVQMPTKDLLPRRLISVIGLQSSGVKFLSNVLAVATGTIPDGRNLVAPASVQSDVVEWEVQSFRLPSRCRCKSDEELNEWRVVEAYVPSGNDGFSPDRDRFIVNITSHIEWYLSRGVDITVVVSMRDRTISTAAKAQYCCLDESTPKEDEVALAFIKDAIKRYGIQSASENSDSVRVIPVSYEAMMELKDTYLFELYHQLGINSTYAPAFKDANGKYVTDIKKEDLKKETPRRRPTNGKKVVGARSKEVLSKMV
ncbi:hypothetical protein HJC23_008527 [Cyclotella cryptica]|uniref:Sulfotransferase domain-containing protein n=1 Tax=Cyclotella cryptica TaxID=29204 RepID=A0ABD3QXD0_9STRA|eukprot:CCRYP_001293-RA/>CCRYP_001293-RA protein AED:0.00 eAED:0.00 QI:292/1/1/1/1/1/2/446/674